MSVVSFDFSPQHANQNVRQANRRMVLSEIILNGPISRTEIATRTGLTPASVSRISREIIEAGLIIEGDDILSKNKLGRRFVQLDANPTGGYILGISINILQQFVTLADLKNRVVARRELALTSFENAGEVLSIVAREAAELIDDAGVPKNRIFGGSVAVTGAVDPDTGIVRSAPLLGWENINVAGQLSEPLGIPIHVESLPNAINLAEARFGIARGCSSTVLFNISLGIGVSMMLDNCLVRGSDFTAGQIGRLSLWKDEYGQRQSVDDVAGGWAVISRHDERSGSETNRKSVPSTRRLLEIMEAADAGDEGARDALFSSGQALGTIVEVATGFLQPEMVVISGPLAWCPHYVAGLRVTLSEATPDGKAPIQVQASDMTWRAAARWLSINEFLLERDINIEELTKEIVA